MIGGLVGAGVGLIGGVIISRIREEAITESCGEVVRSGEVVRIGVLAGAALAAGIGALIGAATRQLTGDGVAARAPAVALTRGPVRPPGR